MKHVREEMIRRNALFFFAILLLAQISCQKRYQLTPINPTKEYENRLVEIHTKKGLKYKLVEYKITDTHIIGKDKSGQNYEELLSEIDKIIVISRHTKNETAVAIVFVAAISAVLLGVIIYSQIEF